MERDHAPGGLPESYANALLLRERGLPSERIAELLGVPGEAIGPLLRLGEAKLERLLAALGPSDPGKEG